MRFSRTDVFLPLHAVSVVPDSLPRCMRHSPDCRYENIPDPESDISLPVITITDFATGEAGKEVILLIAGEHARELITSEIAFWLGKLLAGTPPCTTMDFWATSFLTLLPLPHCRCLLRVDVNFEGACRGDAYGAKRGDANNVCSRER